MSNPNDRQVAGDHYKLTYQHWDWVCDNNVPYLLACAAKYIVRWRKKNGIQDLEKSTHYLEKAMARGTRIGSYSITKTNTFCAQLLPEDAAIVGLVVRNRFEEAIEQINALIASTLEQRPSPGDDGD